MTVASFAICSTLAALAGLLLAGYSSRPSRRWATPTSCPSIAAVVIGGTNILGGAGRYLRHHRRHHPDRAPQRVLSVMQMPEAGRQIIYGVVIVMMLLAYGRGARLRV